MHIIQMKDGSEYDADWLDRDDRVSVYIERADGRGSWVMSPVLVGTDGTHAACNLAGAWADGIDWGAERLECDDEDDEPVMAEPWIDIGGRA